MGANSDEIMGVKTTFRFIEVKKIDLSPDCSSSNAGDMMIVELTSGEKYETKNQIHFGLSSISGRFYPIEETKEK